MDKLFFEKMGGLDWDIVQEKISITDITLDQTAIDRLKNAPQEFIDFICSYSQLINKDETTWFLSYKDYIKSDDDTDFSWNDFEQQSIECADDDNDLLHEINNYWTTHIPFIISVDGEYQYIAIGTGKNNLGKIFHGIEPEYEDSTCIANNLSEFLTSFNGVI